MRKFQCVRLEAAHSEVAAYSHARAIAGAKENGIAPGRLAEHGSQVRCLGKVFACCGILLTAYPALHLVSRLATRDELPILVVHPVSEANVPSILYILWQQPDLHGHTSERLHVFVAHMSHERLERIQQRL